MFAVSPNCVIGHSASLSIHIINDYVCTGQVIYIFPATDKLRISYDAIYSEEGEREEEVVKTQEPCSTEAFESEEFSDEDTSNNDVLEHMDFHNMIWGWICW